MTNAIWVIVGLFALGSVVTVALFGRILIPGAVLAVFVYAYLRPYRGIAVTEAGIVLFDMGPFGAKPTRALALFPYWSLFPPPYLKPTRGRVRLPLGPDVITLLVRDHHWLLNASAPGASFAPFGNPWRRPMLLKIFYGLVIGLLAGAPLGGLLRHALSSVAAGRLGFLVVVGACVWLTFWWCARLEGPRDSVPGPPPPPPGLPAA